MTWHIWDKIIYYVSRNNAIHIDELSVVTALRWMSDMLANVITIVSILFGVFYIWAKWKLTYWERRGVLGLPTNIFFGNFTDSVLLRVSPSYLLGRLYNEAKPDSKFLGIYILHKPFLLLRDPQLIKQMFVRDFDTFSNRHFSVKNGKDLVGTQNLFSINNPEWRYLRGKMSPAFSSSKIKALFNLMIESSQSLSDYLADEFKNNERTVTIEVKDASTRYTTDIISSLAFGIRTNSFDKSSEFYVNSRKAFKIDFFGGFIMFCVFFFPRVAECFGRAMFGEQAQYFRNIFWSSMKAREESKTERGDIIDNLLKLKNENEKGSFEFQGDRLLAQSAIFFIAGLETSAATISFVLWELSKKPNIQERVREEICDKLKDGGLTYENVLEMKYLMQVINETMRLYPPAPIIDRVAEQDYKIPDTNVTIEKGTPVYVALPGIHMDPNYFPNPENFDPDRFDENNKIESYTFMPFGEGPRICIGMRVGMLQTAVGLIRVLQHYRVSINPSYEARVSRQNVFVTPENGIHLYFEKLSFVN